jgi:hypothetical protein
MSQTNSKLTTIPKVYGPNSARMLVCSFGLVTTALTAGEQQGCTVSRTTTGTYVVDLLKVYKDVNVTMGVIAASTAQLFIITAVDLAAKTITIKQVTAGGSTAVDTITATINLQILARTNS